MTEMWSKSLIDGVGMMSGPLMAPGVEP